MKRFIVLTVLISLAISEAIAQKEGNVWYFGNHAGLDFNNDTVITLQNNAMWDNDNSSTVCNSNGQLLFYTNSDTVWNKRHQIMFNGTGLAGSITSGQTALIVPQPGTSRYYIFTNAQFNTDKGLNFSIVDTSEDGGYGAVILKNNQLFPRSTEKLDAIYLAVINFPDIYGPGCGFVNDGVNLGAKKNTAGLSRVPVKPVVSPPIPPPPVVSSIIKIYPNPSDGNFYIEIPYLTTNSLYSLEIWDVLGKIIFRKDISYIEHELLSFPELSPGLYYVKVTTGKETYSQKISIFL